MVVSECEQSAERTDARQHVRRVRPPGERLDPANGLVARIDVHARLSIVDAHQNSSFSISSFGVRRRGERPARSSTPGEVRRRNAPLRSPPTACRTRRGAARCRRARVLGSRPRHEQRRLPKGDQPHAERNGRAHRLVCAAARVEERRQRPSMPAHREHAQRVHGASQQRLDHRRSRRRTPAFFSDTSDWAPHSIPSRQNAAEMVGCTSRRRRLLQRAEHRAQRPVGDLARSP